MDNLLGLVARLQRHLRPAAPPLPWKLPGLSSAGVERGGHAAGKINFSTAFATPLISEHGVSNRAGGVGLNFPSSF